MPTIITHPVIPLALGVGLGTGLLPRRLLVAGVIASIVPDLDVVAFRMGIAYDHAAGHRGLSHSAVFAILMGFLAASVCKRLGVKAMVAFLFVAISGLSHGLLDMLTNGGLGVALAWPFSEERYFFASQVIEVSPIGVRRFLSARGIDVLRSEVIWVWCPAAVMAIGLWLARPRLRNRTVG
jgi:inner membrane protein